MSPRLRGGKVVMYSRGVGTTAPALGSDPGDLDAWWPCSYVEHASGSGVHSCLASHLQGGRESWGAGAPSADPPSPPCAGAVPGPGPHDRSLPSLKSPAALMGTLFALGSCAVAVKSVKASWY